LPKSNHIAKIDWKIITLVKQLRHKEIYKLRPISGKQMRMFFFYPLIISSRELFQAIFIDFCFVFLFSFHVRSGKKQIHESKVIVPRK
jgi:hypothetical protein